MSFLSKGVIIDALAEFSSTGGEKASFSDLIGYHEGKKAWLETSLAASEEKLLDAKSRIETFEHIKEALDDLGTKVDEAEARLKTSKEDVGLQEDRVSEKRKQLAEKDASLGEYRE